MIAHLHLRRKRRRRIARCPLPLRNLRRKVCDVWHVGILVDPDVGIVVIFKPFIGIKPIPPSLPPSPAFSLSHPCSSFPVVSDSSSEGSEEESEEESEEDSSDEDDQEADVGLVKRKKTTPTSAPPAKKMKSIENGGEGEFSCVAIRSIP